MKKSILSSGEIDDWTEKLQIPIPEMIFGNNLLELQHNESGLTITFNAFDALDRVDKTGKDLLQVAHSREWQLARQKRSEADVRNMARPFDWTYTTDYKGTTTIQERDDGFKFEIDDKNEVVITDMAPSETTTTSTEGSALRIKEAESLWVADTRPIPVALLSRPDPILLFDELCLYEDELGDNGIVWLNIKVRVMPERLLVLSRLFLRVDGVLLRIHDTRIYVEFASNTILREYREQEGAYNQIKAKVPVGSRDSSQFLRDANWISKYLPVTKTELQSISLD